MSTTHVDEAYRRTHYNAAGEGVGPDCINCGFGPDAHDADAVCPPQRCRGCGGAFPFDPDADYCLRCAAENRGEVLDDFDAAILSDRYGAYLDNNGPRVGDFVRFADGVERRVSFVTPPDWAPESDAVQTSDGGSFYLGYGYVSFSGSLHPGVPRATLEPTGETRMGSVWFFHHDHYRAANGVDAHVPFRVYECSEEAT